MGTTAPLSNASAKITLTGLPKPGDPACLPASYVGVHFLNDTILGLGDELKH